MKQSQRIMSNTIVLFLRMLLLTFINLYSIRILLDKMGVEYYGIFNAVAGLVTLSSFISGVLDLSIQRFYSYYIGTKQHDRLCHIYSVSIKSSLILTISIVLLLETFGLWYIQNKLVVPIEEVSIAVTCFHFSVVTFACTILRIPFTATIFAHEDMTIYASISCIESLLKLAAAFMIGVVAMNSLTFYSAATMLVSIIVYASYALWSKKKYTECYHYIDTKDAGLYRKMLSFSGWTLFGSFAKMTMVQGSALLLNFFFGSLTNASYAIATQLSNAFTTLSNNMILSVRPAMIKSYAEGNGIYLKSLYNFSNKFMFYLLFVISTPIISEMPLIEKTWLGNSVNQEIILFSRMAIIYTICLAMNNPITIIIQATGKIKRYHLCVESVTLMSLPLAWTLFHFHFEAFHIFTSMTALCLIAHAVRLKCLKDACPLFSIKEYAFSFVLPATAITGVSILLHTSIHLSIHTTIGRMLIEFFVLPPIQMVFIYAVALSKTEKIALKNYAAKFTSKICKILH